MAKHLNLNSAHHHSFGFPAGSTSIFAGSKIAIKSEFPCKKIQKRDEFKIKIDFITRKGSVYLNGEFVGILWKNISDCIIPAVSNNSSDARFTIY